MGRKRRRKERNCLDGVIDASSCGAVDVTVGVCVFVGCVLWGGMRKGKARKGVKNKRQPKEEEPPKKKMAHSQTHTQSNQDTWFLQNLEARLKISGI